ncbi:MAG: WD40 repeat domain-containing protein [Pirellulales bacterium]|nr:WD40 repeat domain-containing protein [Pirellulales bacterium]
MRRRVRVRTGGARAAQGAIHFQVVSMSKLSFPILLGTLLIVGAVFDSRASAEAVPEVSASRIIELAPPDSQEKTPVISSVALDPTGKYLAAVGDDHLVRLFDAQNGRLLHRFDSHVDWVHASVFRPDGQLLATSGADGRIRFWNMDSTTRPHVLVEQLPVIYSLAFSPDGRMLAASGFGDKVWIFDGRQGRLSRELAAPGNDIRALSFSPDGTRLAAAGRAGVVRIWDAESGNQLADVRVSPRRICALEYSPDGKLLAAAGEERVVRLLNVASGEPLFDLPERLGDVLALCFCGPDKLASAGSGNVIHLWGVDSRQELCRLVGHTGSITTLGFDRGAETLISGGFDTTVRLWDLTNQDVDKVTRR